MTAVPGSSTAIFNITQGSFQVTNTDLLGGVSPFAFNTFGNSAYQEPMNYLRSRGTSGSPANCVAGDVVLNQRWQVRANSVPNNDLFTVGVTYGGFTSGTGVYGTYNFAAGGDTANSNVSFTSGNTIFTGNVIISEKLTVANTQLNRFQETVFPIGSTSGTITPDFNNGSIQTMTLTGSITMNTLANAIAGRSMTLIVTQGGTGSYTLTSSMKFQGGTKTLSTAVGAIDVISVFYDGTNYYATLSTGYA
jgi:hypothetical protein